MGVEWKNNIDIADALERVADLLDTQDAMPYRVGAYRKAAATIATWPDSVAQVLAAGGEAGLRELPGVGKSIAAAVAELVRTGRMDLLERLEGQTSPEGLLASVPGIGPELAKRIHEALDITTLEALELAAHDGRLERVEGFGPRRAEQVRELLAARLERNRREREQARSHVHEDVPRPPVGLMLKVDADYRRRAADGELRRIAPKRFNPSGEAWLPVMRERVDGWNMRALFSNTALAHRQKTTHDWVVIYYEQDDLRGQGTVVTAHGGPMDGRRVVKGREDECRAYYAHGEAEHEAPHAGA
ncbi:DNA-binding protein [Corallococcus praedator]|uniref:DNA-binding protein n=1 Tax=Corallococcus praedator TaxID=2316724 RepID=A0ABX9QGN1_9BACT|nr:MULTISPECIES: helix-hairpin-helix domain-containing protein [Corallococcus]RKH27776.1 DNA-binding protein [Corallococcus sp. CA031C]RKI05711.1 DNA-binding protein [Corallococcus praedator]